MSSKYRCGRCGKTKDESEFFRSQRKTGAWCRQCHREYYGRTTAHPTRPCKQCGKDMVDPRPTAIFCSDECKNREKVARDSARRFRASLNRTCQACGSSLAGRPSNTKWCSEKCARTRPTRAGVARRAMLKSKYGLTEAQFDSLLRKQRGTCAICRCETPTNERSWHVDHDHATGQIRGLLCSRCNTGVGQFRDDPELMIRAARYVRMHRQKSAAV